MQREGRRAPRAFVVAGAVAAVAVATSFLAGCSESEEVAVPETTLPAPTDWEPLGEPGVGGAVTDIDIAPDDADVILVAAEEGGIARSIDGGASWAPATGLVSDQVASLTRDPDDPDVVWAGTLGGPHVSADGGLTWSVARAGMPTPARAGFTAPVEVVLFDPANDDRMLAFGGSQSGFPGAGPAGFGIVWESLDQGRGWRQLATVVSGGNITAAGHLPGGRLLAAVAGAGVFASVDGAVWTPASAGLPHAGVRDLAVDPVTDGRAWVTLDAVAGAGGVVLPGGVFRTDDGGLTWVPSGAGLPATVGDAPATSSRFGEIEVAPSDPAVLFVSDLASAVVFRSADGGQSWTPVLDEPARPAHPYASGPAGLSVAVAPDDPSVVLVGTADALLRSTDRGETWTDVASEPAGAGFRGRGLTGLVATGIAVDPETEGRLALSAAQGANPLVADDGSTWARPAAGGAASGGAAAVDIAADGVLVAALVVGGRFDGVLVDVDGSPVVEAGAVVGLPERGSDLVPTGVAVDGSGSGRVALALGGTLYLRDAATGVWAADPALTGALDVAYDVDGSLWATTGTGVARRDEVGWTVLPGSPSGGARIVPGDGVVLVAAPAGSTPGVWGYDAAEGWRLLLEDTGLVDVAQAPWEPGFLIAASSHGPDRDQTEARGVLVSRDGGVTWSSSNDGLATVRVTAVAFDPSQRGRVVIGTAGQGFWQRVYFVAPPPTTTTSPG